jgi:hypothetical protein
MTPKKVYYDLFLTHFSIKFSGSQKMLSPFFSKNINIWIRHQAQSLSFVGFYHRLKYRHNLQSHPVERFGVKVDACEKEKKSQEEKKTKKDSEKIKLFTPCQYEEIKPGIRDHDSGFGTKTKEVQGKKKM